MARRPRTTTILIAGLLACCTAAMATAASSARPTLKASSASIPFGSTNLVLTGKAAHARKGELVHLLSQPCGFTAPAETLKAKTTAKGSFHFTLQPTITTRFHVTWRKASSRDVRVVVRPLVRIGRTNNPHRFAVEVSAGANSFFVGKTILVQRAVGRKWTNAGSAALKQYSSNTAFTAVSAAIVTAPVPSGSLVRGFLSASAAAPCFGASVSADIRA